MAITRNEFFDKKSKGALWDVGVSIKRGNPLPIDADSVFESLDAAREYAAGVLAYPGQIISVVREDRTDLYKIDQNCELQHINDDASVDGASLDQSINGVFSVHGFSVAQAGQQIRVTDKDGIKELEFFTPDSSTVSGLQTTVGQHTTDIAALQEASLDHTTKIGSLETAMGNRYTKEEVDAKLTSAVHYKTSVDSFNDLPKTDNKVGDMYNIKNSGGKDSDGYDILAGDNVVWNGTGWDKQAGYIDTTSFATKDNVATAKAEAISAAATDATTKADAAKAAAIADTDTKLESYDTSTEVTGKITTAKTELTTAIGTAKTEAITAAGTAADEKIATKVGDIGAATTVKKYVDDADNGIKTRLDALEATSEGLGKFATATEIGEADLAAALKTKIDGKADKATTLAGYGIGDAYTKTEVDDAISDAKGEAATTAQSKVDTAIGKLVKADAAVTGKYVSAVSEADGVITVTRADLPNYDNTYDVKGAADAVLGTAEDTAEANTVYGAKKAASAAQTKANKAETDAANAKTAADEAKTAADSKVASVKAQDASVTVQGTTAPTVKVNLDPATDNAIKLGANGLKVTLPEAAEYSIVKDEDSGDFAAVYHLTKGGANTGTAINIPKDMVVKSGKVVTNPTGQPKGTYIELTLQNVTDPLYINVNGLIEYVTSGSVAGDQIVIAVSDDHKVTATLSNGSVTKAQLASGVQTSLNNADSAITKANALETLVGTKTVATQITEAIGALDVDDTAVEKQFVTAVKETDGKIAVTRAAVANIALSGSTDDLVQGTQTLIFDCGGAN